jgi:hypothetical protein
MGTIRPTSPTASRDREGRKARHGLTREFTINERFSFSRGVNTIYHISTLNRTGQMITELGGRFSYFFFYIHIYINMNRNADWGGLFSLSFFFLAPPRTTPDLLDHGGCSFHRGARARHAELQRKKPTSTFRGKVKYRHSALSHQPSEEHAEKMLVE